MKKIFFLLLLMLTASSLFAQEEDFQTFAISSYSAVPLAISNGLSFGFTTEMQLKKWLGIMLDLEFKRRFYSFEEGTWLGPVNWQQVNANGVTRNNWIFYQWDNICTVYFNYHQTLPLSGLTLEQGIGVSLNFIIKAPSIDNYPEFQKYFDDYRQQTVRTLGLQSRTAINYKLTPYLSLGGGIKLKIERFSTVETEIQIIGGGDYFLNNSDLFLYIKAGFL